MRIAALGQHPRDAPAPVLLNVDRKLIFATKSESFYAIAHIRAMFGLGKTLSGSWGYTVDIRKNSMSSRLDDWRGCMPGRTVSIVECKQEGPMDHGKSEGMLRRLMFLLPLFMGGIEYLLRVGFRQPDQEVFLPISLVASGVSLNVALGMLPDRAGGSLARARWQPSLRAIFIAYLGIFASLFGLLLWLYLLLASFSEAVKAIVPVAPLRDSLGYYFLTFWLSECKSRVTR